MFQFILLTDITLNVYLKYESFVQELSFYCQILNYGYQKISTQRTTELSIISSLHFVCIAPKLKEVSQFSICGSIIYCTLKMILINIVDRKANQLI